jgi:GNAT superfamily N-acetyltransferase
VGALPWTSERKLDAALRGPLVRAYVRDDTRIIERPGWYQVVTPSVRTYLNEVLLSQVAPEDADHIIDETLATYREHGARMRWNVGPLTQPADFGERLERRGFQAVPLRAMGIDTAAAFDPRPGGICVEEIDRAGLHGYVVAMLRGWSMTEDQVAEEIRTHAAALAREPRVVHFFGATMDGECVATAALVLHADFGYFIGGQVHERARGRGIYRGLVAARLAFLHARGMGYAVTHAHEATSAPILEHLGFETLFESTSWSFERRL